MAFKKVIKNMNINPKIFKTYDVRGVYPEEINEEAARAVGAAFAIFLKGKTNEIIVGRDARLSSPSLFKALADGIISQGFDVVDIGICTNPMLIFAVQTIGKNIGGIMISSSHCPPDTNGFKLMGEKSVQIIEEKRRKIDELALAGNFKETEKGGTIMAANILDDYLAHIMKFTKEIKGLKVVVDYANGVGSVSGEKIFKKLDIDYIPLHKTLDGNFPNHLPNPLEMKNIAELKERVKTEGADLGIMFDGDGDRVGVVDENGEIVFSDLLVALFAEEELKKYPGGKVYYDLRFSRVVKETVEKNGGQAIMMRVGNPFYKEKMIFENGAFAGEISGHIFFKENFAIDDGLFAAVKIMDLLCKKRKKLSKLANPLKKYFATEEINIKVDNPENVLEKVAEHYKDGHSIDLDGVYIEYPDWWFSLRQSNTEPVVRLRIEASSKNLMEEKRKEITDLLIK